MTAVKLISLTKEYQNGENYIRAVDDGLNQIGIKIDMYRQEHRFSPATPVFRRFDV